MEQVLYKVHVRLLTTTNRYLNYGARRAIEALTLLVAIVLTCTLVILHRTFVSHSSMVETNCILKMLQETTLYNSSTSAVDPTQLTKKFDLVVITIADPYDVYYAHAPTVSVSALNSTWWDSYTPTHVSLSDRCTAADASSASQCQFRHLRPSRDDIGGVRQYSAASKDLNVRRGSYRYYFALQRGTLMLTQEREPPYHRNFTVLDLSITPEMSCLSQKKVSTALARWTSSFDVVVMNWAISAFEGSGYLYNTVSRELFNLNYAADFVAKKGTDMSDMGRRESYTNNANYLVVVWRWLKTNLFSPALVMISGRLAESIEAMGVWMHLEELLTSVVGDPAAVFSRFTAMHAAASVDWKALLKLVYQYVAFRVGVVFSICFLFFISTTLINYILRETQERMLRFTFLLQYHITHRMPFTLLVATHVIGSLVFVPILMGIYFFLFEFFSDQLLAFLVLLVVWMGEVFSVLSLRSDANIKFFPKIFACYFFVFHVYFFSFPFGFCYVALSATACYVVHAMIHFWNVYEVPAFESGRINPVRPRMSGAAPAPAAALDTDAAGAARAARTGGAAAAGGAGAAAAAAGTPATGPASSAHGGAAAEATGRRRRANSHASLHAHGGRSIGAGASLLPGEFLAPIPSASLAMSAQQLQHALLQTQQLKHHSGPPPLQQSLLLQTPTTAEASGRRPRAMTDPSLEDGLSPASGGAASSTASAAQAVASLFNVASRSVSDERGYRDERGPDAELSAAAAPVADGPTLSFMTRPRKNSAPTPGRPPQDAHLQAAPTAPRPAAFPPLAASSPDVLGARRSRADSVSSVSSTGSGTSGAGKVPANIFEPLEARRLRLARNQTLGHPPADAPGRPQALGDAAEAASTDAAPRARTWQEEEEEEETRGTSALLMMSSIESVLSMSSIAPPPPPRQATRFVATGAAAASSSSRDDAADEADGDDDEVVGNFYDDARSPSPRASAAKRDAFATPASATTTTTRARSASASDAFYSTTATTASGKPRFSIFGNAFNEDEDE